MANLCLANVSKVVGLGIMAYDPKPLSLDVTRNQHPKPFEHLEPKGVSQGEPHLQPFGAR